MKKKLNLLCCVLTVFFLLTLFYVYNHLREQFEPVLYALGLVALLMTILTYFINRSDKEPATENDSMQDFLIDDLEVKSAPVFAKPKNTKIESFEPIIKEILSSLQMIEVASNVLMKPVEPSIQVSTSRLITSSVHQIKDSIGQTVYNIDSETEESNIPLELQNIPVQENISDNISIGIYGNIDSDNLKLKLILQSYGFFVRLTNNSQETLFHIEDNLIQMLIISPASEDDECFLLCDTIRQKFTLLDFPILVIVNKYRSYLIEKSFNKKINDFLVRPFDVSALLSRIQILSNYRALYREKEALLTSEKEKRAFLYFVTHNVNTPLTILMNEMQTLSDLRQQISYPDDSVSIDEIIKNIQESTTQINIIIQNVLNSYKISDGRFLINPRILNLQEFIALENKFLISKAEFKKQSFTFECSDEFPQVFCDENSLKGIYTNLVDNAIKYTYKGGNIKVSIDGDDGFLYLRIIDDGQGIPKEKQVVLFNRFANIGSKPTGSEKSVGLGLYVVNEICKLNDLSLEYAENTDAESGSVFTIKFQRIS